MIEKSYEEPFLVFILKITSDRISYITYHDMQKFDFTYSNRWYHIYTYFVWIGDFDSDISPILASHQDRVSDTLRSS